MAEAGYFIDLKRLMFLGEKLSTKTMRYIAIDLQNGIRATLKVRNRAGKGNHSRPGEPPLVETGKSPLKTLVQWNLDERKLNLKVGPELFKDSKGQDLANPVPKVLERGGRVITHVTEYIDVVKRHYRRPKWFLSNASRKRAMRSTGWKKWHDDHKYTVNKPVTIAPRPFVSVVYDKYFHGDGVRRALKRAKGQIPKKGFDTGWKWKEILG